VGTHKSNEDMPDYSFDFLSVSQHRMITAWVFRIWLQK